MNDQKKAKWILGTAGVMLSTILLTQLETSSNEKDDSSPAPALNKITENQQTKMSNREQELVQLDWTNFDVQPVQQAQKIQQRQTQVPYQPDRRSQRS